MYRNSNFHHNGDRFLAFPFLVGALAGGAVVGLSRPRYPYPYPVPYQPYPYQPVPYQYPSSYNSSTNYSYYN